MLTSTLRLYGILSLLGFPNQACNLRVTAFLGPHACGAALFIFDARVCAAAYQLTSDICVAVGSSEHQWRAVEFVLQVRVCAALEQQSCDIPVGASAARTSAVSPSASCRLTFAPGPVSQGQAAASSMKQSERRCRILLNIPFSAAVQKKLSHLFAPRQDGAHQTCACLCPGC